MSNVMWPVQPGQYTQYLRDILDAMRHRGVLNLLLFLSLRVACQPEKKTANPACEKDRKTSWRAKRLFGE